MEDVIAAVAFGRETGLPVAVRGGGHSFPGLSVNDGGVVIDLGLMNAVHVDPEARIARAGAGVREAPPPKPPAPLRPENIEDCWLLL